MGGMSDASLVQDLPLVMVRRVSVTSMDNNVYLLTSRQTGIQVLIDAAGEIETIRRLLSEAGSDSAQPTRLGAVITTHRHHDHIGALAELVAETGAQTLAGGEDAAAIEEATGVSIDRRLSHGDRITVDDVILDVIALRGHTPGAVALGYTPVAGPVLLFTGDSLFPGGPGRVTSPADFDSLMTDLQQRVFDAYSDDTLVYPGHGRPTTLGVERPHLGEWLERGW